jgi:hypothetical protein
MLPLVNADVGSAVIDGGGALIRSLPLAVLTRRCYRKKNGNVQHLRDHGIEPDEAEECFFHDYEIARDDRRFDDVYITMAGLIAAEDSDWSSRTRGTAWHASSPAGN